MARAAQQKKNELFNQLFIYDKGPRETLVWLKIEIVYRILVERI